jgi:hypothetical protein
LFLERSVPPTVCPYRDFWADYWSRMGGRGAAVEPERRGPTGRPQARGRGPLGRELPGRGQRPGRN